MRLSELLNELRCNMLRDSSDQVAGPSDFLWSDETLCRYIDQAQKRFARDTLILRDGTTQEVTQVELVAGQDTYVLHPAVVAVISGRLEGDRDDLHRAGHAAFDAWRSPDPYWWDPANVTYTDPGKPLAFSTDEEISDDGDGRFTCVTLRVYPTPSADYDLKTIQLRVCRKPLYDLTTDDLTVQPEIPEEFQFDMLYWAAGKALEIVDRDQEDIARADRFFQRYEAASAKAKWELQRKLQPKQDWGFGRNGWAYSR